ncbi:hypothetical protein PbJCM13498_19730 [Prolixibacter bellariivorans]|uniref:RNA polymerase sigma factor n=1 Tax=Prolixibacter bellariivorans TaxID=314319 RepID=A0A5M4AYY3_9BACT|nr:sigma-70 family RNA polymerase sigma factor [Prolixibacter bellariivorans]GET33110.1 hypothetical protein PbJCM13498_19730 [Prolixibacter bellariivorans]
MEEKSSSKLSPEKWLDLHGDYLFNFAVSRVFSPDLAKDLIQDSFVSALHNQSSFRGESSERTWLVAILKRKIIDHYRKQNVRKEEPIADSSSPFRQEGILKGHWDEMHAPQHEFVEKDNLYDNNEFMRILNYCLSLLPPRLAAIFSLKVVEEMDTEDVCKEMDVTPSNIWTMLHRSRLKLRACIERNWF